VPLPLTPHCLAPTPQFLMFRCGRYSFDLCRPLVMGILNVTPDSFSDGGQFLSPQKAIEQGLRLREAGADLLDIGGESTRPGAQSVSVQEELDRVMPVLDGLSTCGAALSVDTMKPAVMAEALAAGADMINDVQALTAPGALKAVAENECGICLMHMQGQPRTMQDAPQYQDVVAQVSAYLTQRWHDCRLAGIAADRIVIDPGFGFGKTLSHNQTLFKELRRLSDIAPVLVGVSRKSMIGQITGQAVQGRLAGSLAAAMLAVQSGAAILRVHDVAETADVLKVMQTLGVEQ